VVKYFDTRKEANQIAKNHNGSKVKMGGFYSREEGEMIKYHIIKDNGKLFLHEDGQFKGYYAR
jgi:hypothetical protein